jgi:Tol biopolymer transport system component
VKRRSVAAVSALVALLSSGCALLVRSSSVPADGQAVGVYGQPSISANGRYVAYAARTDSRVPDAQFAVYVMDDATHTVEVVSVSTSGELADAWSGEPSISADGRYVAFSSDATNLVTGDTGNHSDVFVRDRVAHTTQRVSLGAVGNQLNNESYQPSISGDGRYIAFTSDADNVVGPDGNLWSDVFVRDRVANTTVRVDLGSANEWPQNGASDPEISADGHYVVFTTDEALTIDDLNDNFDVYRRDLVLNQTVRVSNVADGGSAGSISADGRFVSFSSNMKLTAADTNIGTDIFRRDLNGSALAAVSVGPAGNTVNGNSTRSSISADGRYVAFSSTANITGTDANGTVADTFVRDMQLNRSSLAGTATFLAQPSVGTAFGHISGDGRYITFTSTAALETTDTNNVNDVFVRALVIPEITNVAPGTVARGSMKTFTVNGNNFRPGARARVAGIDASSVTVLNEHALTLQVTLPLNTALGPADVYVNNLGTGAGPNTGTVGKCGGCVTVT